MKKLIFVLIIIYFQASTSFSFDLKNFKETCSELGFQKGTEKHGSCVLTLYKKSKNTKDINKTKETNQSNDLIKQQQINIKQREFQLRQNELKAQQELINEIKKERSLRYLGIATKGLEMMGPKKGSSSSSKTNKTYNFGCRTYGINTLCQGN